MRPRIDAVGRWAAVLLLAASTWAAGDGLPTGKPAELGFSLERLERIDRHLQGQIDAGLYPGAVALIARHGRIVYHRAFGQADLEAGTPMRTDAIFRLASMTKAITSVAAMTLYEEGRFRLSDPVSKYIPEFADAKVLVEVNEADSSYTSVPAERPVTILHLLTHTSGLAYSSFHDKMRPIYRKADIPDAFDIRAITTGEKMRALAGLPLDHQPGEFFLYGLSTDMLGYLVEVVSGMPLDRFLRERVLDPLQMDDTWFYLSGDRADRLTAVYADEDGVLTRYTRASANLPPHVSADYPIDGAGTYFSGGGGLSGTSSDYARLCQMLLNGGELDGVRILSPRTVELMAADHVATGTAWSPDEDVRFGLGFAVSPAPGIAHELGAAEGTFAWGGYWGTSFWIDPETDLIGILMTQVQPRSYDLGTYETLVYQALVE